MAELTKRMELAKVIRMQDKHDVFVLQYDIIIEEDGVEIARSGSTTVLEPDMDIDTIEDADVKNAAVYYWTKDKIKSFKDSKVK